MSDLAPTGPSQPTQSQAYTTPGNPSTKNPSERAQAAQTQASNTDPENPKTDHRVAQTQSSGDDARHGEWGLGRGIHGAGAGEEKYGKTEEDVGRHRELDGEQMAMPGEGRVADAVAGRGQKGNGVGGEQEDLASDLDRKKAEQAPAREAMKEKRRHDFDVGGILGQRGGPVNPPSAK